MAHAIKWHTPNHLLQITLEGAITAAEVQTIADEVYSIYAAVPGEWRMHMIIDMRYAKMADKVFSYARLSTETSERAGWTVMVGDAKLVGLICSIYSKLTGATFHFANSVDEGVKFLAERDSAIEEISVTEGDIT